MRVIKRRLYIVVVVVVVIIEAGRQDGAAADMDAPSAVPEGRRRQA